MDSVINNYVSCFHVLCDVKGSGCIDHPCLDGSCKEHNNFHKRIMMPVDHMNLWGGVNRLGDGGIMESLSWKHEKYIPCVWIKWFSTRDILERFFLQCSSNILISAIAQNLHVKCFTGELTLAPQKSTHFQCEWGVVLKNERHNPVCADSSGWITFPFWGKLNM